MTNRNHIQILQQFHTIAVTQKLSAAAILLWQYVYFIGAAQGRFTELHLRTADVQNTLTITRNGLQKVRRALVAKGLMQVRIDYHQQVYYTLTLEGTPVEDCLAHTSDPDDDTDDDSAKGPQGPNGTGRKNNPRDMKQNKMQNKLQDKRRAGSTCTQQAPAKPYTPDAQYPGDIIRDDTYRKLIKSFCSRFDTQEGNRLELSLYHFLHKRKQQGKTLTKAGLDAILDKLVTLAEQNVRTMVNIVEQSIQRGWMGVYAYTGSAGANHRPAGEAHSTPRYTRPSAIPAYNTAYVDLSFLEL